MSRKFTVNRRDVLRAFAPTIERHETNPYDQDVVATDSKKVRVSVESMRVTDEQTGQSVPLKYEFRKQRDTQRFIRIFHEKLPALASLSLNAIRMFLYVVYQLGPGRSKFTLDPGAARLEWLKLDPEKTNRQAVYDAINELISFDIIARDKRNNTFYINHQWAFNGNRLHRSDD